MSRKQSSLKTVMTLVVAATVAMNLANVPQSFAQSSTPQDSTTTPSPESGLNNQPIYTLSGHTGDVASVAFSPDGQTMVSGSFDKTLKLWNLKTGKLLRTLTGHSDFVRAVAISPDGQTIVSGGGGTEVNTDKTIRLWNLKTGKLLGTLQGHSQGISSLAIAPDGQTLVTASYDKTIKLWNLKTLKRLATLSGHSSWVRSVVITPDGQTIVSIGGSAENNTDKTIKLWNLKTGKLLHTLSGHSKEVTAVAIAPDRQTIVSAGSPDKEIKLWNLKTGELLSTLKMPSLFGSTSFIAISPNGETLVTAAYDCSVRLWNLRTGELLGTLAQGLTAEMSMHVGRIYPSSLAFSPDGKTLAIGRGGLSGLFDLSIDIRRLELPSRLSEGSQNRAAGRIEI